MRTVWLKKLLDKFYSININNDCDILEFFSNHTIFYSIGEYIFSQIDKDLHEKNNNRVLKDKTIKSVFSCESLYNSKEFHYNDLKHMNDLDEVIWSEIINSDFKKLHEDAWNITNILINRFNCRYVVTQVFSDDFISVLQLTQIQSQKV